LAKFGLDKGVHYKGYYLDYICRHCNSEFPGLISYSRFVYLMPRVLPALSLLMLKMCGETNGIAFVDSTTLTVCHKKRVKRNRVFAGIAKSSKSTMGWFFGFKLHLVINDCGEIISFKVTQGNVDDRKPLPGLAKNLWGKLFVTTQGQVFERPLLLGEGDFGSPKSGEGFPLRGQVWPSQESILQSNQDVFTILSHS
jgi:hypothetical protein